MKVFRTLVLLEKASHRSITHSSRMITSGHRVCLCVARDRRSLCPGRHATDPMPMADRPCPHPGTHSGAHPYDRAEQRTSVQVGAALAVRVRDGLGAVAEAGLGEQVVDV